METQAEYKIKGSTQYLPVKMLYCAQCDSYLGDEIVIHWKHNRRGWVKSHAFIRKVDGFPVAKLFVRGEIGCKCGHREVWNG